MINEPSQLLPPRLAQKEGRCLANASRNQLIHGLPPRVPGPASPSLLDDALVLISPQIPTSTLYLTSLRLTTTVPFTSASTILPASSKAVVYGEASARCTTTRVALHVAFWFRSKSVTCRPLYHTVIDVVMN